LELLSDSDLDISVKLAAESDPLRLVEQGFLSIKTKDSRLVKLQLNSTQQKLFRRIKELRAQKKPIRIWILKYRQGGVSTEIEAIIYALTSQQENRNSLILADEKEHADNLFEMFKLYQEQLEIDRRYLAPRLKKSNEKKLEYQDIHSQIIIASAENKESAKSHTFQYVHLSEIAYFPDLKTVLADLNQTVPDHWDTIVIGETTANGMNEFYLEWQRAVEGKTDWIPLFFPWFEMKEYSLPLQNGGLYSLDGIVFNADSSVVTFEIDERDLKARNGLTDEQLNWRRYAIVNKCQGDIGRFNQEYPATWELAFAMSGEQFFNRDGLNRQVSKRPIAVGELYYEHMKYVFRPYQHGRIQIYEYPNPQDQYTIGADASEAVGLDEAAIVVLNKLYNSTAAEVVGNIAPEELAELLILLGNYYNQAMVAPENKGYGYMVCQLVAKKYGNIYRRVRNADGSDTATDELGWNTNSVTRPQMLAQFNEEIAHGSTQMVSKKLIDECRTFVIKKDKDGKAVKVEAQTGFQDGLVICYDDKTRVLTADGWKYFKDVEEGALIPSVNLCNNNVEFVKNKNTVILDYFGGEMVHFTSKSIDLLVTPEHRVVAGVSRGQNRFSEFKFCYAKDLVGKRFRFKKSAQWSGRELKNWTIPAYSNGGTRIIERNTQGKIIRCSGNQYVKQERYVRIKEFLQFIGFFIAEGSGYKNRISLSQMPYSKGWEPIKKCLFNMGVNYKELKDRFEIRDTQFSYYIKRLIPGYCYEKRIPREILNLSPELLKHLFDFMMLGDGCGDAVYITTSKGLADDFNELVNKLGWSANIKAKDVRGSGGVINGRKIAAKHIVYIISINRKNLLPRLNFDEYYNKQVVSEQYNGKVYCLALEKNHTLLVERNGKTCWSGNCRSIAGMVRMQYPYKAVKTQQATILEARRVQELRKPIGYGR
jgi:hypothetical protein